MIVMVLIPKPRIAGLVSANIGLAVIEVVGFAHWWGLTINGVLTIYILISVGLAVDYSVHIAHFFRDEVGTSEERAVQSLARIGPSVFQAIFSTILAVLVLSNSKSFVFYTFFQALFLVTTIAGAHGMLLLPVILGLAGGDNVEESYAAGKTDLESAPEPRLAADKVVEQLESQAQMPGATAIGRLEGA